MRERIVKEILSVVEMIIGTGGSLYTLAYLIPVNPVAGMAGFIISLCVLIVGLDNGADIDEMDMKK